MMRMMMMTEMGLVQLLFLFKIKDLHVGSLEETY